MGSALKRLSGVYQEGWSFPAQFHHTATGGWTCCLATDCKNLRFTLKQLNRRERMEALSILADWLSVCGRWAARAVCTRLWNGVACCLWQTLWAGSWAPQPFPLHYQLRLHTRLPLQPRVPGTRDQGEPRRPQRQSWSFVLSTDLWLQVMLVIDAAVSHLDDLHSLEDFLLNLGRKHQAVGVKPQSFAVWST